MRVFRELHNVQDNDRLLVLVTHGFLELLVNALIDAKCKNAKRIKVGDCVAVGVAGVRNGDGLHELREKAVLPSVTTKAQWLGRFADKEPRCP